MLMYVSSSLNYLMCSLYTLQTMYEASSYRYVLSTYVSLNEILTKPLGTKVPKAARLRLNTN